MSRWVLRLVLASFLGGLAVSAFGAVEWPSYRGPGYNGAVAAPGTFESGSIGLDLAWRVPLGSGYSGITVADGKAVTMFAEGESDWVAAFDVKSGRELWRVKLDAIYKGADGSDDGPLSSPTIGGGSVYALSPRGYLLAVSIEDGKQRWKQRIDETFGAQKPSYGFSTTPLVAGKVVVLQAGGSDGRAIVGLSAEDGKRVWAHGDGTVYYQSPVLMTLAGAEQIVAVSSAGIDGIAADSGSLLWQRPFAEDERPAGAATPTFIGDDRFLVGVSGKLAAFKLSKAEAGFEIEELYQTDALGQNYAQPVYHDGYLYGYRGNILTCVDAATGERVWRSREPGGDGLILVDRHLVIFGGLGNVVVAAASPEGYKEQARLQALSGSGLTWPSFADGRVYVRNLTEMAAVAVTREATSLSRGKVPGHLEFGRWLARAEGAENAPALVDELLASGHSMPMAEGEYVTFVYRGDVKDVAIAGTMIENESTQPMQRVAGTDLFYRTFRLEPGLRWEYRFQIDFDDWVTDPLNPRTVPGLEGEDEVSELVTAGYRAEEAVAPAGGTLGRTETFALKSEALDTEKTIQVWLPPGYEASDERYPVLIVNDGTSWLDKAGMVDTLNRVVGKTVTPVIVAFVEPANPWWQEAMDSRVAGYIKMQTEELLPALRERYRLSEEPGVHGTMGNRYYAAAAIQTALRHPEVFGRVGLQSVYTSGPLLEEVRKAIGDAEPPSLRFYLDWNRYDERNVDRGYDLGSQSESLAGLLKEHGFRVAGGEAADSAGWSGWRQRTDDLLAALFPSR